MTPCNSVDMSMFLRNMTPTLRHRNARVFFYPADGSSSFIDTVYVYLPEYRALHSTIQCSAFMKRPFYFIIN
jgi:hypothetical protein